jgi:hypothetical protein
MPDVPSATEDAMMDKQLFDELVQSLKQAKDIAHGKAKPSRQFTVPKDKEKQEISGGGATDGTTA